MKFKCGLTVEEQIAKDARDAARREYLQNWHPFYTVLPRSVAPGDCRMFEEIERKGTYFAVSRSDIPSWHWEYRAKERS